MEIAPAYIEKFRPAAQAILLPRSPWEEQLDHFLEKLNPGREADGYKPYTHSRLARILSKAGVHDADAAYILFRKCESGNSFSRLFSYLTRV